MKWINRLLKKIFSEKKDEMLTDKILRISFKGKAWPSDVIEKSRWNDGWQMGFDWTMKNYFIDDTGRANVWGDCLRKVMQENKIEGVEACGAAEGITSALGELNNAMSKTNIDELFN